MNPTETLCGYTSHTSDHCSASHGIRSRVTGRSKAVVTHQHLHPVLVQQLRGLQGSCLGSSLGVKGSSAWPVSSIGFSLVPIATAMPSSQMLIMNVIIQICQPYPLPLHHTIHSSLDVSTAALMWERYLSWLGARGLLGCLLMKTWRYANSGWGV